MKANENPRSTSLLAAACLMAILLAGCSALKPKPAGLSEEQVGQVTQNLLQAIDAGDYTRFIQDFSDPMLAAFPQTEFEKLRGLLLDTSGAFRAISGHTLSNNGEYALYTFTTEYEKETVATTVTFKIGGTQVEGLFFSSENLKQATQ